MAKKKRRAKKKKVLRKVIRRKPAKKSIKKKVVAKRKVAKKRKITKVAAKKKPENVIGVVTHYFPKVRAAVIKLKANLTNGDNIKIKGHTTDFTQSINSMQIDHVPVSIAHKGQEIGVLVNSRVRQHDIVTKV